MTTAQQPSTPEHWLGRRLGKYEITKVLASSGKGLVFLAHDTAIKREARISPARSTLSFTQFRIGRDESRDVGL